MRLFGLPHLLVTRGAALFALPFMVSCGSRVEPGDDASIDSSIDVAAEAASDADAAPDVGDEACAGACCCEGDVQDFVTCTAAGPTCKSGFGLFHGDDCRCLPDRDTPCCLPHVRDGGF